MTDHPDPVDNGDVVPNRGRLEITITLTKDSGVLDLTGKTVTATVRRETAAATVVHADLEDHAVSLTTPALGIVKLTIVDADLQKILVPDNPTRASVLSLAFLSHR